MIMQTIVTVTCAVLASSGFWAFLSQRDRKTSAETRGIKALLHDRIYDECKRRIGEGTISPDDYENLRYLYEPYRDLGGNGTCERLMHEVDRLPLTEKEV